MATDQALADALLAAGVTAGDRAWQLPLWDEYREMVKSEIADVKNLAGAAGGSITAGAFLAHFAGDFPFAHLDIADGLGRQAQQGVPGRRWHGRGRRPRRAVPAYPRRLSRTFRETVER